MRRRIKGLLAIGLIVSLLCMSMPFTVMADDIIISEENPAYQYVILEDGTIALYDRWDTIALRDSAVKNGVAVIPSSLDGYTVSTIASLGSSNVRVLILPDTVKTIEPWAFYYGCASLEMIFLPQGLETVSWWITCSESLKEVVIPSSVTSLEGSAFGLKPGNPSIPGDNGIVEDFVYYSYNNPCAIAAAAEMGFQHVDLGQFAKGDFDRDAKVDMVDAFAVYHVASGGNIGNPVGNCIADMNSDGQNDMRDAMALYAIASGG